MSAINDLLRWHQQQTYIKLARRVCPGYEADTGEAELAGVVFERIGLQPSEFQRLRVPDRISWLRKAAKCPIGHRTESSIPLTPEAKTILEALVSEGNMTVTQESLADATHLSLPTVRKNLDYLRDNNLIHRPHGPRKGDAITDAGRAILARS